MTREGRHNALIIGLCLISGFAKAQFVNFRLEIPAGISFTSEILDPMEGGTWENSKAKVWIRIESQENLTFLLDLNFPEGKVLPSPEAHFLNDGTDDFEKAIKLREGIQELRMISHPGLIQEMIPRPTHIQAWLGLPALNGITIKIEYP